MKKCNQKKCILLFFLMILCLVPFMGQELITDRPDFTESASTVPMNSWQFEFGYTYAKGEPITLHSIGEFLVRFSPLEKLELRFGLNSYLIALNKLDQQGFEDMEFGIKYSILRDQVCLLVSTTLPSGSPEFKNSKLQPMVKLTLAHDINDFLSIGSNLGWSRLQMDNGDWFTQYLASIALEVSITSKLGMFVEYFGFYTSKEGIEDRHYIDTGFTYLFTPLFQVDIRAGRRTNNKDDYFWGVGAVFRI